MLAQDDALARRVGAVTLGVLAVAIAFFVVVYDRIEWGRHLRVRVRFHETAGLAEGAPFVVAGRAVGQVESISLEAAGVVAVIALPVGAAESVDAGGEVFVASRGVLAAKYLELAPPNEPTRAVRDGDTFVGRDPPSLDHVLQRTWDNLSTFAKFRDELRPELDALSSRIDELRARAKDLPNSERFTELVADAGETWREVGELRDHSLGGDPGLARLGDTIARGRALAGQGREALDRLDQKAAALRANVSAVGDRLAARGDALDKLSLAIDRARADTDKLDELLAHVQDLLAIIPDGSLGKLSSDPEFPEDAKELGRYLKRHPWKIIEKPRD